MENLQARIDREVIRQVAAFADSNRAFVANVLPAALRRSEQRERRNTEDSAVATLAALDLT